MTSLDIAVLKTGLEDQCTRVKLDVETEKRHRIDRDSEFNSSIAAMQKQLDGLEIADTLLDGSIQRLGQVLRNEFEKLLGDLWKELETEVEARKDADAKHATALEKVKGDLQQEKQERQAGDQALLSRLDQLSATLAQERQDREAALREEQRARYLAIQKVNEDLMTALKEEKAARDQAIERACVAVKKDIDAVKALLPPLEQKLRQVESNLSDEIRSLQGMLRSETAARNADVAELKNSLERHQTRLDTLASETKISLQAHVTSVEGIRVDIRRSMETNVQDLQERMERMFEEERQRRVRLGDDVRAERLAREALGTDLITLQNQLQEVRNIALQEHRDVLMGLAEDAVNRERRAREEALADLDTAVRNSQRRLELQVNGLNTALEQRLEELSADVGRDREGQRGSLAAVNRRIDQTDDRLNQLDDRVHENRNHVTEVGNQNAELTRTQGALEVRVVRLESFRTHVREGVH